MFQQEVISQNSMRVTYEVSPLETTFFDDILKSSLVVVFNDSLVYSYMIHDKNDPMKKKQEAYGESFIGHGSYYRRGEAGFYHTSIINHRPVTKDSSKVKLVYHTYNPKEWTFYKLGKKIYGYDTESAVYFNESEDGVADTTIVWFAPVLSSWKNVMGEFAGVNGFPMEIQQQRPERKMIVTKIERGEFEISFPSSVEILTHEEFHNRYHSPKSKKGRQRQPSTLNEIILKYY